ncbi:MAG: AAA family ATPase [Sporichthyaceae bacterium]
MTASAAPHAPSGGVRAELASRIAADGLSLLDAWLGPKPVKQDMLAVLYAGRHLLLEGPVGSGKTLVASSIARALPTVVLAGCDFGCLPGEMACPQCRAWGANAPPPREVAGTARLVRVQGSPDLVPEDLVGDLDPAAALRYGASDVRALRPGRLLRAHRRILFLDEVNRLSERLQNLLLELLEERAMTVGGYDVRFDIDTVVVATMNPAEYVGVERLSEALADRFERVRLDYPSPEDEVAILRGRVPHVAGVEPPPADVADTVVGFANALRTDPAVRTPPSVRAALSAYELAATHHALNPRAGWDGAVVAGIRLAFRGRIALAHTVPDPDRVDAWLESRLEQSV